MNTPPFPAISSPVSRHPDILRIGARDARRRQAQPVAHPPFPSIPTHQSVASAINLVDEENEQAPRPIEAEALPGNAGDDAMIRVISRVDQTLSAWRLSTADQDRHVSADRLQLAAQHDRWRATEQARRVLKEICPRGNNKVIIYFLIS